jgi:Tfp pilus assembly protein PilN
MATKEMTHLGTYVVPKVNLLPPEIDEKKAQQRSYVAMGAVVVAAVGAVGFLYAAQSARVGKAQEDLAATQRKGTALSAERAKLSYVDAKFAEVDAHEAMLGHAVEKRIRWSRNLHDISLTMPNEVWLGKLIIAQEMGDKGGASDKTTVLPDPGLGTVTFEGMAFTHDQVASWLDAMSKLKGYSNPYFSKSEIKKPSDDAPPEDRTRVEWKGTVAVNSALLDSKSVTK